MRCTIHHLAALVAVIAALCISAACGSAPLSATVSTAPQAAVATPDAEKPGVSGSAGLAAADAPEVVPAAADKGTAKVARPAGWTDASHSKDADPDYETVFPQDKINRITITMSPEDWDAMQANMQELFGEAGAGGRSANRGPAAGGLQGGMQPPPEGGFPGGDAGPGRPGGIGRNPDLTPVNPDWVEATVRFNGETWTHVGVRYKGNSTLTQAWRADSDKLPLKLDFDQFEDVYPEIDDQRFYGFKQLSLGNNMNDATYLRDTLAYDVFEAGGLVAPETTLVEVLLDHGDGPSSLGVYTLVEVVDDTVIEKAFAEPDGNIYEADGAAASFAAGTDGQIEASFKKENNEDAADWSDIRALYDALHAGSRTSDAARWRADLEAVFNVDTFLNWLALNTVIQDWDAYGTMSHNYYLYHDPATGKLEWISWDHNEAFQARGGPGGRGGQGGPGGPGGDTSLDKTAVGENWPLIRFLLDDPVYKARYVAYLRGAITPAFDPDDLGKEIDAWAELIRPYAEKQTQPQAFDTATAQLKAFLAQRLTAVEAYLAEQD